MPTINNQKPIYWTQYLCTIAATVCVFLTGIHMGWTGPTVPKIHELINMSSTEEAWLANFLQVGGLPAPFIGSYLCDRFGRQKTLLLTSIPNFVSFLLIFLANNMPTLYVARFCCGIAVGFNFVAAPTYIGEISSPEIRGIMGAIMGLMIGLGVIFEFCVVPVVSIKTNALICMAITVVGGIGTYFIPDTPYYFIMAGNKEKSAQNLKILRQRDDVDKECTELELAWEANKDQISGHLQFFKSKFNVHYFMVIVGIFAAQTFSGMIQVMTFAPSIIEEFHIPMDNSIGGAIIMCTMTLTALVCSFFIDRWGRKPLFYISTFGGAGPLIIIGTYLFVQNVDSPFATAWSFLPLISLIIYTICFGMGLNTLPYIFISELFSTRSRASAACLAQFTSSLMGIVAMQAFQIVRVSCGTYTTFWACGAINVLFGIFCILLIPETKGKNLCDIDLIHSNQLDIEVAKK